MEKVFEISRAAEIRFGMNSPLEVLARRTEELGEIASEVDAREGSKSKSAKDLSGEKLCSEIHDLLRAIAALIDHYDVLDELNETIRRSHQLWQDDGHIQKNSST